MTKRIWLSMLTAVMFGVFTLSSNLAYAERADSSSRKMIDSTPAQSPFKNLFNFSNTYSSEDMDVSPVHSAINTDSEDEGRAYRDTPYMQPHELPKCPRPAICPNIRGEYTLNNADMDINSKYSRIYTDIDGYRWSTSLSSAKYYPERYCPRVCTMTRRVVKDANNKIIRHFPAICPDGYAQVGVYNMQDEIVYNPVAKDMPFPIMTREEYDSYIERGYYCFDSGLDVNDQQFCKQSDGAPATLGDHWMRYQHGDRIGNIKYINGYEGQGIGRLRTLVHSGCYNIYEGGCHTSIGNCVLSCSVQNLSGGAKIHCHHASSSGVPFTTNVKVLYKYRKCRMPQGLSFSNEKAPASVICARQTPVFKKL